MQRLDLSSRQFLGDRDKPHQSVELALSCVDRRVAFPIRKYVHLWSIVYFCSFAFSSLFPLASIALVKDPRRKPLSSRTGTLNIRATSTIENRFLPILSFVFAGVFWLFWFWLVVYRRAQHQQFRPIVALRKLSKSVPSLDLPLDSLRQPLIGQALVGTSADHTVEPVHGTALDVAVVQTEGKFVNISAKMLMTNLVIDTSDPALECPVTAHACERGEFNHGL
jgi:hypothetical protein